MIEKSEKHVESLKAVTIERRLLNAIILKIQQTLNSLRSEVRGKAKVALFGTIVISPGNHFDKLTEVGNHREIAQPQRDLMQAEYRDFGFHPFIIDVDAADQKPMDTSGGMPSGCPPMKIVDGRVFIESHSDCITCPFKGLAFDLRGETTIAFPPEQFPPDIELLGGELWVQDYRSESAIHNLANIKINGPDHIANVKPTRETGLKYTDGQGVSVFSKIGDTWVRIDYIPGDQKLVEKDFLYYLLVNDIDAGADGEVCIPADDAGAGEGSGSVSGAGGEVKDASAVGAEPLAVKEIAGGTASCSASPAGFSGLTGHNLEGALTLGFLVILGTRGKNGKKENAAIKKKGS
jgi:hypothetical protein